MYKYKTIDGLDCFIPGVGATVDGFIEVDHILEAPSLVLVSGPDEKQPAAVVGTEVAQPNVITEATPVATTTAPAPVPVPVAAPVAPTPISNAPQQEIN